MEGTKTLLSSRTFWGAVIMLLASTLALFGVEIGEEERTHIAYMLAEVGGFALTVWGRIAASKSIEKKNITNENASTLNKTGLCLLLFIPLTISACALKDMSPQEQAMVVTNECASTYEELYQSYRQLYANMPEHCDFLKSSVAPLMDNTKRSLVALGDATTLWVRTNQKPPDWEVSKQNVLNLLTEISIILGKLQGQQAMQGGKS